MRYLLLLTTLCFLAACAPMTTPTLPAPVATSAPSATPTPTAPTQPPATQSEVTPSPGTTPAPEIAVAPTPSPATGDTSGCDVPVHPLFLAAWEANGSVCPDRAAEEGDGASQTFTGGLMLWLSESDEEPAYIYVLNQDLTWQRFEDLWQEGDPGSADLTPPPGALEPIRGFGLVWRDRLGGPGADIGWATQAETGHSVTVQRFGEDTIIATPQQTYWLFADGTWAHVLLL